MSQMVEDTLKVLRAYNLWLAEMSTSFAREETLFNQWISWWARK
jgi:hypothetical protein